MPASKNLQNYPEWMFGVAEFFAKGGTEMRVPMPTHGAAINSRQRFYTFRSLMIKESAALYAPMNAVQIRLEEPNILVFESMDHGAIAMAVKQQLDKLNAELGNSPHPLRRADDYPQPEQPQETPQFMHPPVAEETNEDEAFQQWMAGNKDIPV